MVKLTLVGLRSNIGRQFCVLAIRDFKMMCLKPRYVFRSLYLS